MMTLTYIITLGSQCCLDHKSDKWGEGALCDTKQGKK